MSHRPILGVTFGDPAGIGPEVVLGALADGEVYDRCIPIVIGNAAVLRRCAAASGVPAGETRPIESPKDAVGRAGVIDLINVETPGIDCLQPGFISAEAGAAAAVYVRRACELALAGEVDAITTAPINKEALRLARVEHIGHTEMLASYLASRSGDPGYKAEALTLFITGNMRIFFLSRHLSLRQAIELHHCRPRIRLHPTSAFGDGRSRLHESSDRACGAEPSCE